MSVICRGIYRGVGGVKVFFSVFDYQNASPYQNFPLCLDVAVRLTITCFKLCSVGLISGWL